VNQILHHCTLLSIECDVEVIWNPGRDASHRGCHENPTLEIIAVMVHGDDIVVHRAELERIHLWAWDRLCEMS
jgi:hypothetical protein